jgi:sugar O-acyltransferase (sialic acid O-acetyltransferase NeuD family)
MIMDYMNTQPMFTNKVIVFGTNDLAELTHWYLSNDSDYEIVAFTVNRDYLKKDTFKGLPVIAFEELEKLYPPTEYLFFAPMTGTKMNNNRKRIYEDGKKKGYQYISYISSKATICGNKIGENCFILEDNTLQPFTEIGNNVIMWSGNHIGHHGIIEDHVFFTSHVVLSGHCHVKERAWFGVNSTIRDGLTIGEGCLIGMGSLVTKSTDDDGLYIGTPAKKQVAPASKVY